MAILDTSLNEINNKLEKKLTLEELDSILFDFGLEIDKYELSSDELKIDITADRPDLLSFQGFIRALKAYLNEGYPSSIKVHSSNYKVIVNNNLRKIRPYTVCAVIKNLNLDSKSIKDIIWAQEKLHQTLARKRKAGAIGIYPLENIEFPINFLAKDPKDISFIPLGENKEFNGLEILSNHPKGKEYAHLLKSYEMYPVFIDNKNAYLSLPPIINSKQTGAVTTQTKEVFIECSGFNMERLKQILNIIVTMFSDLGGDVYSVEVKYDYNHLKQIKTPNLDFEKMIVDNSKLNSILGTNISQKDSCNYLKKMMYLTKTKSKDKIEVLIPPFRSDILHTVDIADDLARAYGFSNINFKKPQIATVGGLHKDTIIQDNIINIMTSLGYQEVEPLTLSSKKEIFEDFNITGENYVSLGHCEDKFLNVIINWLTPKLLDVLRNNKHMFYPQKIFYCNYIVEKDEAKDVKSITNLHLAGMFANNKVSFTKMLSEVYTLFNILGVDFELKESEHNFYIKGRSVDFYIGSQNIGHLGEIDPKVLKNKDYLIPICSFEIDISKIKK